MHIQCTYNLYPLTMLQVRVQHEKQCMWSPRETYVITLRVNVRDHLKRQQTWSPQESSYVTTSRIIVRDHLKRQRTCLPRECPRVQAGVEMGNELSLTWRDSGRLVIEIVELTTLVKFWEKCCVIVIVVCLSILQSNNLITWRSSKVLLVVIYAWKSNLFGPISCQNITQGEHDRTVKGNGIKYKKKY